MTLEGDLTNWRTLARLRLDDWKAERERRIQAEQERDDARREALALRADQPRPLTADDITDEMECRLIRKGVEFAWFSERDINDRDTRDKVRALLVAALTEPTRPEGAERWEDFLIDSLDYQALTDQQITDLADRIAEEMNR